MAEASVRTQVANVADAAPVQDAWKEGRKNLWVHGLVYEVETGTLRDFNVTRGLPSALWGGVVAVAREVTPQVYS